MTRLPCGKEVDTDRDQCCVTVCDRSEVGGQIDQKTRMRLDSPPRRDRCLAADACPHWAERHKQERLDAKHQSRIGR